MVRIEKKEGFIRIPPNHYSRAAKRGGFHAQYNWTTGAPDNGKGNGGSFCAVPRLYPLRPLVSYFVYPKGPTIKKIQSRSNFLISLKKFQSRRLEFPIKNRAAVSGSLEDFILARNFQSRSKSQFFFYLLALWVIGVETGGLLDYQGRAGDHFHCTVEPSPGQIRCRGFHTGGLPDLDLSFLFCPLVSFLGLSRCFRDFPDLLGDGPGIFPIRPFSLSRPIKSTYEEQSRKGPWHNLDLSLKKWENARFGNPPV